MEMGVKKTSYGNKKTILIGQDSFYCALPVMLKGDPNEVLKTGQPLYQYSGSHKYYERLNQPYGSAVDSDGNGVLLHEVTLDENGDGNGTMVIVGCIDLLKVDSDIRVVLKETLFAYNCNIILTEGSAI